MGAYGLTSVVHLPELKYFFIAALFAFPFFMTKKDMAWRCMMGAIFFLVFTTGISVQFFVLPIALAALRPSKGSILYSVVASAFLLGSDVGLHLPILNRLGINVVWMAAAYWFISENYTIIFKPK